jgi:hypothetical protein
LGAVLSRREYPTSIRLTERDKKRLRKFADRERYSLTGLIQMILKQWLEIKEKKEVASPLPEEHIK